MNITTALINGALILLLVVYLILRILWHTQKTALFRYDTRNPARRFCKKCGQQQNEHTRGGPNNTWWEDISPVLKPDCECHKHSEYRR